MSRDPFPFCQRLHFCLQVHSLRFSAVSVLRSSALDLRLWGSLRVTKGGVLPEDVVELESLSLAAVLDPEPC